MFGSDISCPSFISHKSRLQVLASSPDTLCRDVQTSIHFLIFSNEQRRPHFDRFFSLVGRLFNPPSRSSLNSHHVLLYFIEGIVLVRTSYLFSPANTVHSDGCGERTEVAAEMVYRSIYLPYIGPYANGLSR